MEPSPIPQEPTTRIRVIETLHTAVPTPGPRPGAALEIAIYPDRIARPSDPLELSPSRALRFADDPGRVAASAQTAGSRTTVTSSTRARDPQAGEFDSPSDASSAGGSSPERGKPRETFTHEREQAPASEAPRPDAPRGHEEQAQESQAPPREAPPPHGETEQTPVHEPRRTPPSGRTPADGAHDAEGVERTGSIRTERGNASPSVWSLPPTGRPPAPPPRVPWWRRLLGLGR